MIKANWCLTQNFGDLITPYLIEKITGERPIYSEGKEENGGTIYQVTGSILNHDIKNCVAWGAGIARFEDGVPVKEITAVRGPLTAKRARNCGRHVPNVYGDPALLLPRYYTPEFTNVYNVGFMPHYVDLEFVKGTLNDRAFVIDVTQDVETVINDMAKCRFIYSSSLHGLIVADAYGIPNRWTKFSDKIEGDGFKYLDYYESVHLPEINLPHVVVSESDFKNTILNISTDHTEIMIDLDLLYEACPFKP